MEIPREANDSDGKVRCNERVRKLMNKPFNSSVDDKPFSADKVHIMSYELYQSVREGNADADVFANILDQVCTQNQLHWSTVFNQVTPMGDSLLHVAAEFGRKEVVELIAFHCPKLLNKTNMKGDTPLHAAARAKNIEAIKVILDIYEDPLISEMTELIDKSKFIMSPNIFGHTALHDAVSHKHLEGVAFLLDAHRESDLIAYWTWNDNYGCKSPIYLAVLTGNVEILCLLLRIPFPSNHQAISKGDSPLHAAISGRNPDILQQIVNIKEELMYQRDENNNTPLHYAAYVGYEEDVRIMSNKSTLAAFQRNTDGNLPIHLASKKGHIQVVKIFLGNEWFNAELCLNSKGQNILHVAAMCGQNHMLKCLLRKIKIHDEIVNGRDVNGDTPLHLASKKFYLWSLLHLSRDNRIDVNLVNNQGLTAQDVAMMQSKFPITRQEFLAMVILKCAGVPLKANLLSARRVVSTNKEWNVKEAASTLMVVAILITTVTFAAGFTVPGGFHSSDHTILKERGMAVLTNQTLFKIFMAFNTIAMYGSTIGSVVLLWVHLGDNRIAQGVYCRARSLVSLALLTMTVAFLAAIRLVVSNNTLLAYVIYVLTIIFIFFIIFIQILQTYHLGTRRPFFRQIGVLFIWVLVLSFYGKKDVLIDEEEHEIDQNHQDDKANQVDPVRKK